MIFPFNHHFEAETKKKFSCLQKRRNRLFMFFRIVDDLCPLDNRTSRETSLTQIQCIILASVAKNTELFGNFPNMGGGGSSQSHNLFTLKKTLNHCQISKMINKSSGNSLPKRVGLRSFLKQLKICQLWADLQ